MNRRAFLMGCPIDRFDMDQTIAAVESHIKKKIPCQHVVVNAAKLVYMQKDLKLKEIIPSCDIINADGMSVIWASRILGDPLPCRVAGIDLFQELVAVCAEKNYHPYFFGAREEVVQKVVDKFKVKFPDLEVAGFRNGYFDKSEERKIAENIRKSDADILFVGFSSPKKEEYLNKWIHFMQVPFSMGVGGSFDIVAGKTKRSPMWMQKMGLEWLFRIYQEPRRMWKRYARTNPVFIWMVIKELLRKDLKR